MTANEIARMESFESAVAAAPREITSVYCADLLSWAMGRAPADCAWCTVMGNVNAVAVAALADIAVIVLCEGALLDADARARAKQQDISIVQTTLPAFNAALAIAEKSGLYPRKGL